MSDDVRCPECSRLLAKKNDDGELLIRYRDRYAVTVKVGNVTCMKCGYSISVGVLRSPTTGTWGQRRAN